MIYYHDVIVTYASGYSEVNEYSVCMNASPSYIRVWINSLHLVVL